MSISFSSSHSLKDVSCQPATLLGELVVIGSCATACKSMSSMCTAWTWATFVGPFLQCCQPEVGRGRTCHQCVWCANA
eukprot:35442-Chlamydomonas_euryale.AAC.6